MGKKKSSLFEFAYIPVQTAGALWKYHNRDTGADFLGRLSKALYGLSSVLSFYAYVTCACHGAPEKGYFKKLGLGYPSELCGKGGKEYKDIEIALVVAHEDAWFFEIKVFNAFNLNLDAR